MRIDGQDVQVRLHRRARQKRLDEVQIVAEVDQADCPERRNEAQRIEDGENPRMKNVLERITGKNPETPSFPGERTIVLPVSASMNRHFSSPWLSGKCPGGNRACNPAGGSECRFPTRCDTDLVFRSFREESS